MNYVSKTMAAKLATAVLVLFACVQAMAAGSLAIDSLQGEKYGFSFNHPSSEQADQRSMRECGSDCAVVLRFGGECAAYAADQAKGSNAYGWGTGATASIVQQRALSECRSRGGSSCKVRAWGCDATVSSSQDTASKEKAAAIGFPMLGEWLVDYVSARGYTANGTLRVSENLGNGTFRGVLVLAYTSEGESKRVQQDAVITVRGDTVTLNASNPVLLLGQGGYNPDNYALTIAGPNLLRGKNSDSAGTGGAVVISRK